MVDRITIADIAKMADTSVATVSKVLNGRPGISGPVRDQILDLAKQVGYRPRGKGIQKRAKLIDLVLRGISNPWASCVLAGAESEAAQAGVGLVISVSHGRDMGNPQWIDRLSRRHSDGLVLVVSRLTDGVDSELARLRIPYVIVDPIGIVPPGVPVVGATNTEGGRTAVDHLVELGHRRIAIITGPKNITCAQQRLDGYQAGLARAGIQPNPDYVHYGDFEVEGGYKAAKALLALPDPPTAIFAGSDLQANGVYRAASEEGLILPQDLSVVGFDDSPLCDWMIPTLTTIRQPLEDMARQATRILLSITNGQGYPGTTNIQLATSLVVRESTCSPRFP
ncbi:MAG: LacI family DNA-binding transcriptional regulator [Propionibacteriaceae bacterium]|jgi:LacI family transcriptional regulator|nr:LacI family DNA-binding transcriptional regulator [Propionibacteriaceae bacterium]